MTEHIDPPKDLPREQLMDLAGEVLKDHPGAIVHFKFTCPHCGTRCTLQMPNVLFEDGECYNCGRTEPITNGGFMVILEAA